MRGCAEKKGQKKNQMSNLTYNDISYAAEGKDYKTAVLSVALQLNTSKTSSVTYMLKCNCVTAYKGCLIRNPSIIGVLNFKRSLFMV